MEVFLKILGSQESGYSGNKPNQRGKYVLIPNEVWNLLPHLTTTNLNDFKSLNIFFSETHHTVVNYVYNNAKFHASLGLKRAHNERRVYRNSVLDNFLNLDRNVIIILIKLAQKDSFFAISILPNSKNYTYFENLVLKNSKPNNKFCMFNNIPKEFNDFSEFDKFSINNAYQPINYSSKQPAINQALQLISTTRRQQPGSPNDPTLPLASLINSQDDFKKIVRQAYGGVCAIRKNSLVKSSFEGLQAAHIQPHSHRGPLLPTNGILLSSDIHNAFEKGFFSLDKDNKIMIHKDLDSSSALYSFKGYKIEPLPTYTLFSPHTDYVNYHRNNIYKS